MTVYVEDCPEGNFVSGSTEECVHQCKKDMYWENSLQIRCVASCESKYAKKQNSNDITFTCQEQEGCSPNEYKIENLNTKTISCVKECDKDWYYQNDRCVATCETKFYYVDGGKKICVEGCTSTPLGLPYVRRSTDGGPDECVNDCSSYGGFIKNGTCEDSCD